MAIVKVLICVLCLFQLACVSYQSKVGGSRRLFSQGRAAEAAALVKPLALEPSDDQLPYLLDYATYLQTSKKYSEATKYFLLAEDIAKIKDYHSLSNLTGSLLFSQRMVQYKGENYEKLMINVMLALNFLIQSDLEGALVETRKINHMLDLFRSEAKKKYQQNPLAHYLAAMIWEDDKKFDDAFIDYKKLHKLYPDLTLVREPLVRSAYLSRRMGEYRRLNKKFKLNLKPKDIRLNKKYGELIVIFAQGWAPRKHPNRADFRFPWLHPVLSETKSARVYVGEGATSYPSKLLLDVEHVALSTFKEDYGALLAKRLAAKVVKEVAADQIRQKNEGLGNLAWLVMTVADQADLRQWSTLPQSFQVARVRLPVGKHKVKIKGVDSFGDETGESLEPTSITINPIKKTYLYWRSYY